MYISIHIYLSVQRERGVKKNPISNYVASEFINIWPFLFHQYPHTFPLLDLFESNSQTCHLIVNISVCISIRKGLLNMLHP